MTRREAFLVFAAAAIIAAGGCAGAPRPGVPIDPGRVQDLVARAMSDMASGPLRGVGDGWIAEAGDSLGFAFAVLYDPPGWLRGDARPLPAVGPGASGLSALVEGDRLTAWLAASGSWLGTDLRDVLPGIERTDPGAFVVGRPDLGFLVRLRHPRLERAANEIAVSGDLYGRSVLAAFDTTSFRVTRIALSDGDERSVTVSYGGHGWNRDATMPRTVVVTYTDGDRSINLTLTYDRVAPEGFVDRREHAVEPPPGAPAIGWGDLGIGRKP